MPGAPNSRPTQVFSEMVAKTRSFSTSHYIIALKILSNNLAVFLTGSEWRVYF